MLQARRTAQVEPRNVREFARIPSHTIAIKTSINILVATPRQQLEQERLNEAAAEAEKCKRDFAYFVEKAWRVLEPDTKCEPGIHLAAICQHLQGIKEGTLTPRLIINCPPRAGKSIIVSILYPCWVWLTYPSSRFLCTSHKVDLANSLSEKRMKVIQSDWYQGHWSDSFQLAKQTTEVFTNDKQGEQRSSSYGGATGFGASGKGSGISLHHICNGSSG